jgi:diguanylate cyclase
VNGFAQPSLRDSFRGKGATFVRRAYGLRCLRLATLGLGVAQVLWLVRPGWPLWVLLGVYALLWPHAAVRMARGATVPYRAELRNLLLDAFMGGFLIIAMRCNVLPSVLILALVGMDTMAAGGPRMLVSGVISTVLGTLGGWLVFGLELAAHTSMITLAFCVPAILLYPVALGSVMHAIARTLAVRSRSLEDLSRQDGLTGLINRRHWESLLAEEFALCRNGRRSSCLMLFDLDHFKTVNDTYGHVIGDEVLKRFAKLLERALRDSDIIGRFGGEEFGVLLTDTTLEQARSVVARVFDEIRADSHQATPLYLCTASAGLMPYLPTLATHHAWLTLADAALYQAKREGRDRVIEGVAMPAPVAQRA